MRYLYFGGNAVIYRIGTESELEPMRDKLPPLVYEDLCTGTFVLDDYFGAGRDYLSEGGYSLIIEAADDLPAFKAIIDYEQHPCEWAMRMRGEGDFLSALYLMNNEFCIAVFMPIAIAPSELLCDMEENGHV